MPTPTWIKIATITKTSSGTIDFTSIPATYTDLVVTGNLRGTGAGSVVNCWYRFNGDSGANYVDARAYVNSGGGFGNDTTNNLTENYIGAIAGASGISGITTPIYININGYTNSAIYRHTMSLQTCYGYEGVYRQGVWRNTSSAINQITFLTGASFEVGSTVTLWGIAAAA